MGFLGFRLFCRYRARAPPGAVPGVAYSLPFVQGSGAETRTVAQLTSV